MADLSMKAVHQFWHDYDDPMIYRVITFMEGVEDWTLDGHPEVEQGLKHLGDEIGEIGSEELGQEDLFIQVASNLRTGRSLRLLQALDTAHPGAASKLLMYAEEVSTREDDPPGVFLRRNIVFERLRLLARVFSPERFDLVLKALDAVD